MFQARALLQAHAPELAALVTEENGKTLSDAHGEVARGLEAVEFACAAPANTAGTFSRNAARGIDVHSVREPLGVVACITPFNFPLMVPLWMLANALACGNAVILKPSEKAPSAPLRLAEVLLEAGIPPGVLNVINGDRDVVEHLLGHAGVDAVSFIGSTPVARHIYNRAAAAGKRVQALGGAKNHMVVLPDADVAAAADAAIAAGFGAAGERCMAISVVVTVGSAADAHIPAMEQRIGQLKVGAGTEADAHFGPLITREHRDRVAGYLDAARQDGATVVVDGREHHAAGLPGFYIGPSLVDRVTPKMSVYADEVFGPLLAVVRADSLAEAIRIVNENRYGNGAAIFTRDGAAAREFEAACAIGMIGINVPIPVPVGWFSFGGWKSSLFGDSAMYGPDGARFFTRQKVVTSRW